MRLCGKERMEGQLICTQSLFQNKQLEEIGNGIWILCGSFQNEIY